MLETGRRRRHTERTSGFRSRLLCFVLSCLVLSDVLPCVSCLIFRCAVKVPKTVEMWAEELKTANAAVNGGTDTKVIFAFYPVLRKSMDCAADD